MFPINLKEDSSKIPIFNNPLFIKADINQNDNKNYLTYNDNNIMEITSDKNYLTQVNILNKNKKNIYVKKNIHIKHHRSNSERDFNKILCSKLNNNHKKFSNSRNNIKKGFKNYREYNIIEENENSSSNQNIININLIKEKNNYVENNIINKIYLNENTRNMVHSQLNESINNIDQNINNNYKMNLTGRNYLRRKSKYIYHYFTNNNTNKNNTNNKENETSYIRKNFKKRINYLPKVKIKNSFDNNEFYIVKIQSAIRGYLLNKRLDKILRNYINIKEANFIIKRYYKRIIFKLIKRIKQNRKKYSLQNIYYYKKRNYSQRNLIVQEKKNDEFHLETKINELIKEKNELQTNYQNLKEFMNKYKQLISEKEEMIREIDKLRQINNILIDKQQHDLIRDNIKQYNKFKIQKQNELNFVNNKKISLNKENNIKLKELKNQSLDTFLTSGKDNNEAIQNNKDELKLYKLKYLLKYKENKLKNILCKYFFKFKYLDLINSVNKIEIKPKISVINRRYNNLENSNNFVSYISIKTLSDNSSVFNDGKGKNLSIFTGTNIAEEDIKKKFNFHFN